jgi:hypothetical protein
LSRTIAGGWKGERQLEGRKTVLALSARCVRQLLAGKGDTPHDRSLCQR